MRKGQAGPHTLSRRYGMALHRRRHRCNELLRHVQGRWEDSPDGCLMGGVAAKGGLQGMVPIVSRRGRGGRAPKHARDLGERIFKRSNLQRRRARNGYSKKE